MTTQFILLITCADRPGIVAGVALCIAEQGCNILESAQYSDETTGTFFMRIAFAPPPELDIEGMRRAFEPVAARFGFNWQIHDAAKKIRAAIMVSKSGHCLNDLLYRTSTGRLPMEVTSIISNHTAWQRRRTRRYRLSLSAGNCRNQDYAGGKADCAFGRATGRSGNPGALYAGAV